MWLSGSRFRKRSGRNGPRVSRYLRISRSTGTMLARMLRWRMTTPFGSAVAPDVKMISATSSRVIWTCGTEPVGAPVELAPAARSRAANASAGGARRRRPARRLASTIAARRAQERRRRAVVDRARRRRREQAAPEATIHSGRFSPQTTTLSPLRSPRRPTGRQTRAPPGPHRVSMRAAAVSVVIDKEVSLQGDEIVEEIEESLPTHRQHYPPGLLIDLSTAEIRIQFDSFACGSSSAAPPGTSAPRRSRALVRQGHEVTALVRQPGRAERLAGPGVTTIIGDIAKPDSVRRGCADLRSAGAHRVRSIGARSAGGWRRRGGAARRGARTPARRPAGPHPLHVEHVGARRRPDGATEEAALRPTAFVAWRLSQEQALLSDARAAGVRAADRSPRHRLRRCGRSGRGTAEERRERTDPGGRRRQQSLALHLRPRSRRPVRPLGGRTPTPKGSSTPPTTATSGCWTSWRRFAPHAAAARGAPRAAGRGPRQAGARTPTRWRSIRWCAARAPARWGGHPTLHSITGSVVRLLEEFRTSREAA